MVVETSTTLFWDPTVSSFWKLKIGAVASLAAAKSGNGLANSIFQPAPAGRLNGTLLK